jgi:capsular polysaccharide biosynthesis protein
MIESPEAFRFISYVVSRWRLVAGSCLTAILLATAVSLLLPREYTSTARILIEPPSGADPRSTVAVSQIYLESLKTYEFFANSDSLFQKAVDRFRLREGTKPIESLKKQVLRIGIVRNTRILEIKATVSDARRAQALAQYLAEETVAMSGSLDSGERLTIIDPGVVPERPSSPNVSLNVAAALLLGLIFPASYLAVEMNLRQQRVLADLARRG